MEEYFKYYNNIVSEDLELYTYTEKQRSKFIKNKGPENSPKEDKRKQLRKKRKR